MKIAYLIAAHNNYAHLEKLINTLNDPQVFFYIHIDKKSRVPFNLDNLSNVNFIKNRVKVYWAGFSQVKATLNLLREALPGNYDYYVFISGVDYPIRPNNMLYQTLKEGGEFLETMPGFVEHKPEKRVNRYSFDCFNRRNFFSPKTIFYSALEFTLARIIKRKYPFGEIYQGSNWFALTHNCIKYILDYVDANPAYSKFYSTTRSPDESFFHTIIGNSEFYQKVRPNLTYADWSEGKSGPAMIDAQHVEKFKDQEYFNGVAGVYRPFFARKFSNDSAEIVTIIENQLRSNAHNDHNLVNLKLF